MQNASAAAPTYTAVTLAVTKSHAPWLMCGDGLLSAHERFISQQTTQEEANADVFGYRLPPVRRAHATPRVTDLLVMLLMYLQ